MSLLQNSVSAVNCAISVGRTAWGSGQRRPEFRDAEYLIDRECDQAEHEVAFNLDGAAHADEPRAEFILQPGVDSFGHGSKIKNYVLGVGHVNEFHPLDFSGPLGLGSMLGAFQRYLCLSCGCNFTITPRGKPPAMKALALLLYAMGNVTFGSIARILGVSDVAVLNWVRDEARKLPEPSTKAEVVVVTLDEMWRFVKKKTEKLWLWRAYDPIARRTIAWVLGRRDDATCQKLLNKIGLEGKTFVTDDWEGYHRLIPDDQLFTGKDLTVPIEQDNSNIRHFLARFRRRTKVVSKVVEMVDLSLRGSTTTSTTTLTPSPKKLRFFRAK